MYLCARWTDVYQHLCRMKHKDLNLHSNALTHTHTHAQRTCSLTNTPDRAAPWSTEVLDTNPIANAGIDVSTVR